MTGRIGTAEGRADEVTGVTEVGVGGAGDRADLPGRDRLRVGAVLCDADRDGTEPTEEDGGPADDSRADDLCSADFTEPCDPQPETRSAPAKTAAHRRTARCITTSGYAALTELPEDHTPRRAWPSNRATAAGARLVARIAVGSRHAAGGDRLRSTGDRMTGSSP